MLCNKRVVAERDFAHCFMLEAADKEDERGESMAALMMFLNVVKES